MKILMTAYALYLLEVASCSKCDARKNSYGDYKVTLTNKQHRVLLELHAYGRLKPEEITFGYLAWVRDG